MLLLLTTAILLKRYGAQAITPPAPTPTSSPFDAPIFARNNISDVCHSRTVLDILWSCLATMFACTWVSVHPNVPFEGEGKWTLLRRRIFLMFFSILAPEFMVVWAFKQWKAAVIIKTAINNAIPNSDRLWTSVHGHFLQMGGFRFSITRDEYNVTLIDPEHVTGTSGDHLLEGVLTGKAFVKLLTKNLIRFPTITEDEINDRSKGDALSKGIALLQLTWFIVQIIARAAQGLAITELELTTAALAGINSVMYIFWWSKPRDVRFPVMIRTRGAEKLLAGSTEDTIWSFSYQEFHLREYLCTSMRTSITEMAGALHKCLVLFLRTIRNVPSNLGVLLRHLHSNLSRSYRCFVKTIGGLKRRKSDVPVIVDPEPHIEKEDVSRTQQIYTALMSGAKAVLYCFAFLFSVPAYIINSALIVPIAEILSNTSSEFISLPTVFARRNQFRVFSMMLYSADTDVKPLLTTASIAGALFGGVHCLAWHFSFPSHVEQFIWRTASLGIVCACALTIIGTYTGHYFVDIVDRDVLPKICSFFVRLLGVTSMLLTSTVYYISRLLLLALAVAALRSLPSSAFDTIQWLDFVPHI